MYKSISLFFSFFVVTAAIRSDNLSIAVKSYSNLTRLEDQVKSLEEQVNDLEDEVKDLNEKLSAAQSGMTNKEDLVKQHVKVAEEAVSEAATLKNHLESVTLLKLTAEDSAMNQDLRNNKHH
ncbi:hypothetical protein HAX54_047236 [Datura stramonium]|uniref:Uncharacterized protein n=1 Tax=Datura stramonium TaxID=4076 RepID=A0ABS8SS98_DATST|nr:hypothetical protein [Datura stramonium]